MESISKNNISIDEKRKYIYNNIDSIINTRNIINFIINSEISYSKNKNGMHVNISVLNEKDINGLYDIIFYEINEKIDDDKYLCEYNDAIKDLEIKNETQIQNTTYETIKLTDIQKEMINLLL